MSRPSSSVPNQCAALGGCSREGKSMWLGFCGAIQGANSAKTTNTATSTMPADASTLRRPSVAAVLQVVEAIAQVNHKGHKGHKDSKVPRFPLCSLAVKCYLSTVCVINFFNARKNVSFCSGVPM